jgi:hypothetical protein
VRVVAVLSFRHSGSTLVGDVLGAAPGVLYVGESAAAVERLAKGRRCSCGVRLDECDALGIGGLRGFGEAKPEPRQADPLFSTSIWSAIARGRLGTVPPELVQHAAIQQTILRRARDGVDVVVDSSKPLPLVAQLAQDPRIDLTIVFVQRDVRDVVNSCQRAGSVRGLSLASRRRKALSALADGARWLMTSTYASRVLAANGVPVLELNLDDWVRDAGRTIPALGHELGLAIPMDADGVPLGERHVVWGYKNGRQGRDRVQLRPPTSEREQLGPVVLATLNLIGRMDAVLNGRRTGALSWRRTPSSQAAADGLG